MSEVQNKNYETHILSHWTCQLEGSIPWRAISNNENTEVTVKEDNGIGSFLEVLSANT